MVLVTSAGTWAQAASTWSPAAAAYLALKRWCGGETLSPTSPAPDWGTAWVVLAGPALLLVVALAAQGPSTSLRQAFDVFGLASLVRQGASRLFRSGRLVTAMLGLIVVAWTAAQCLSFGFDDPERRRSDLVSLRRSRGPVEVVAEHAIGAFATPLRDVAALGDNFPALLGAAILVFAMHRARPRRTIFEPETPSSAAEADRMRTWQAVVGTCIVLYGLYRMFSRIAGGGEIPVGNCLILEVAIVPGLMLICDGFLLAWVLAEIRDGDPDDDRNGYGDLGRAYRLMPAACLGCIAALPARYTTVALLLASQHIPAALMATEFGRYVRWTLGPGLFYQQAASMAAMGVIGGIAWGGGSFAEALTAFGRLIRREGGRLAALSLVAGLACAAAASSSYAVLLLLPPAGWVLPAADAYAHYVTLPIGLLTLASLVQLAERTLPAANLVEVVEPEAQQADSAEAEETSPASQAG